MRKYRKRRKSYESAGRSPYRRKTGSKIVNGVIIAVVSSMILGILSGIFAPRSQGAAADPTDPTVPPVTDSYIPPSGTLNITSNGIHNVAQYESVNVNVSQTVTGGDCAAEHIIPVDELPTENIDPNAVYLCKGAYYKYTEEIAGMLQIQNGEKKYASVESGNILVIPTKTENVSNSLEIGYYIEDEADFFVYYDGWSSYSEIGFSFGGFVADESEATAEGYYAVLTRVWTKYFTGTQVIEVTELPTENIDTTALYSCGGAYYKCANEFVDVIYAASGDTISYADPVSTGVIVSFNIIPTKTTDDVLVSDENVLHFYYIEDEDHVFCFDNANGWTSLSAVGLGSYNGIIADRSEATADGFYALMTRGWTKYLASTD